MRLEQRVTVKIRDSKVLVAGREYDVPHALIIGADSMRADIGSERVYIEASFDRVPETEMQNGEVLKVIRANSRYEVDTIGETVQFSRESDHYRIEGRIVSIRFDVDDDRVSVKLPKIGRITGRTVKIHVEGYTSSVNIIMIPFVMGVMSIYNARCLASQSSSKEISIECSKA